MRIIIYLLIIFSFIRCKQNNELEAEYYYDSKSYDIYSFLDNSELIVYNLKDSIKKNHEYEFKNEILRIGNKEYSYNVVDTRDLIVNDFFGEYSELNLNRINISDFDYRSIDSTVWKLSFSQIPKEKNKNLIEEQFLKVSYNDGIFAYTLKESDTIPFAHYSFSGYLFNKFIVFNRGNGYESILFYDYNKNDSIKILHNNGFLKSLRYDLEKIEVGPNSILNSTNDNVSNCD